MEAAEVEEETASSSQNVEFVDKMGAKVILIQVKKIDRYMKSSLWVYLTFSVTLKFIKHVKNWNKIVLKLIINAYEYSRMF